MASDAMVTFNYEKLTLMNAKVFCCRSFQLLLFSLILLGDLASQTLGHLDKEIQRLEELSGGKLGIGIIHLESGTSLFYNENEMFPMASTYKIPVAIKVLQRIENGDFALDSLVHISAKDIHPGSGTISRLLDDPGVALSVLNLLELMMLISDNSATDLCIKLAGGPGEINAMLAENGIHEITVDRPTVALIANYLGMDLKADKDPTMKEFNEAADSIPEEEREAAMSIFSQDPRDQSSPEDMARLMQLIWSGKVLNPQHTDLLLDIMYRCETGQSRLKGQLPPGTKVAHKTGTIGGTTNDVGIIDLPDDAGHVIVAAFVKDSNRGVGQREKAIAHVARAVHDYFLFVRK